MQLLAPRYYLLLQVLAQALLLVVVAVVAGCSALASLCDSSVVGDNVAAAAAGVVVAAGAEWLTLLLAIAVLETFQHYWKMEWVAAMLMLQVATVGCCHGFVCVVQSRG